jgi:beta-galactosidase
LRLRGKNYEQGWGVQAPNQMVFELKPEYDHFVALAGVDEGILAVSNGSNLAMIPTVVFKIYIDGRLMQVSPVMRISEPPWRFDIPIPPGSHRISLNTTDAGDGNREDLADWVNAGFTVRDK